MLIENGLDDGANVHFGGAVDFATFCGTFEKWSGNATIFGEEGWVARRFKLAQLLE